MGSFQAHTSGQEPSPVGVGFEAQYISCLFRNQFFCLWLSHVIIVHFQVLLAMIFFPPSLRIEMIWTVKVSMHLPSKYFFELHMISRWFSSKSLQLIMKANYSTALRLCLYPPNPCGDTNFISLSKYCFFWGWGGWETAHSATCFQMWVSLLRTHVQKAGDV